MNKGFTLIELILYIALASAMLGSISFFLALDLQSQIKYQVISEVEQQGMQVMQHITQTIRNAQGINSPAQGTSAATLSLDVVTTLDDPTVYSLTGDVLNITEGAQTALALTNSQVQVVSLSFSNLSRAATAGVITVQLTLSYVNTAGRQEYDYTKNFYATAALR